MTTPLAKSPQRSPAPVRILFVCLGNICRSPAAEGVMRQLVADAGLEGRFLIDSAGMGDWHVGQLPDARMRRCAARHGYRLDSRARQFCDEDFKRFDLILAMDTGNQAQLLASTWTPQQKAKVGMLADYMTQHPGRHTIPDPYYGDDSDFELALELIEDACQGLLSQLA